MWREPSSKKNREEEKERKTSSTYTSGFSSLLCNMVGMKKAERINMSALALSID
jgi:hypothetical protein